MKLYSKKIQVNKQTKYIYKKKKKKKKKKKLSGNCKKNTVFYDVCHKMTIIRRGYLISLDGLGHGLLSSQIKIILTDYICASMLICVDEGGQIKQDNYPIYPKYWDTFLPYLS